MSSLWLDVTFPSSPAQTFPLQRGWNRLVRSWAVHWLRLANYEILRFTNGACEANGSPADDGGGFFFTSLVLRGDGIITPMILRPFELAAGANYTLARPLPNGQQHYWPPRAPKVWRFQLNARGTLAPAQGPIAPTGTPLTGLPAWIVEGVHREQLMRTALTSGQPVYGSSVQFAACGIWQPSGIHEAYAQGGDELEPSPGWEQNYVYRALSSDARRERNQVDLLDKTTGEPIATPWHVDLQDYGKSQGRYGPPWCVITGGDQWYHIYGPKDWNSGVCPYRDALLAFDIEDGEHGVRKVRHDVAGAALWGDPCCAFNLRVEALRVLDAWPVSRLRTLGPASKGCLGRQLGWCAWIVAAALDQFAGTNAGHAFLEWILEMTRVFVDVQTPCGTWQNWLYPWSGGSPSPAAYGAPVTAGYAQSLENGILIAGAFSIWNQLAIGPLRTSLGESIMRAADVFALPDAAPLKKYFQVSGTGRWFSRAKPSIGDPDTWYVWWSLTYASRVAHAQPVSLAGRLWAQVTRKNVSPSRYTDAMLRIQHAVSASSLSAQFSQVGTYIAFTMDAAVDLGQVAP